MYLASTAPGHLAGVDAPLLARLWLAPAYTDEATAQVRALGLLVRAPNSGLPIQSRWAATMNRQTDIACKLAAELALPPAQRSRARWRCATRFPRTTSGASDARARDSRTHHQPGPEEANRVRASL
jgi:hypothetical protein